LRDAPATLTRSRVAEEIAIVASAHREMLLRAHAFRLRRDDLEDCFSQATLELLAQTGPTGAFASRRHIVNTLELRFLSRVHDRRRALGGRSPSQAAIEEAVALGASDDECAVVIVDRNAALEARVLLREELRAIERCARQLTLDQRLALVSQLSGDAGQTLCDRLGWSQEKYRKLAQRARVRLRKLVESDGAGASSRRLHVGLEAGTDL
jgi:DNA-directed RNA polymerase specialized sigma24 family protein